MNVKLKFPLLPVLFLFFPKFFWKFLSGKKIDTYAKIFSLNKPV